MAADHAFVNGTDVEVADITAATATTAACAARSVSAASSTSADVATFLHTAGAYAVIPTAATAEHKKAIAITLLLSAGVTLDEAGTAALLADPQVREQIRLKNSRSNGQKLSRAVY